MFVIADSQNQQDAVIKVMGVGGGGGNAVQHMVSSSVEGVEFICLNTDAQALKTLDKSGARTVLQIGANLTKGLGAGANPEMGRQAATEDREAIMSSIEGADMLFITAGMGGGTGTGAAPVVAQLARDMGVLTVAIVTKPFNFEGKKRMAIAEEGIRQLTQYVDSLIVIPNERLLSVLGKGVTLLEGFKAANNVLLGAVQGISDLITHPGLINVDFADVRTVMAEMGMAMMGTGRGTGEDRARLAAEAAVASPLLDDINLRGARGVLVNITAGLDLSIGEFEEIGNIIKEYACDTATVVVGTSLEPDMNDEMRVTVVATGLGQEPVAKPHIVIDNHAANHSHSRERQHERPSGGRRVGNDRLSVVQAETGNKNMDYLDIPAFLRRQTT